MAASAGAARDAIPNTAIHSKRQQRLRSPHGRRGPRLSWFRPGRWRAGAGADVELFVGVAEVYSTVLGRDEEGPGDLSRGESLGGELGNRFALSPSPQTATRIGQQTTAHSRQNGPRRTGTREPNPRDDALGGCEPAPQMARSRGGDSDASRELAVRQPQHTPPALSLGLLVAATNVSTDDA
jgi:hypothetical protein